MIEILPDEERLGSNYGDIYKHPLTGQDITVIGAYSKVETFKEQYLAVVCDNKLEEILAFDAHFLGSIPKLEKTLKGWTKHKKGLFGSYIHNKKDFIKIYMDRIPAEHDTKIYRVDWCSRYSNIKPKVLGRFQLLSEALDYIQNRIDRGTLGNVSYYPINSLRY